MMNNMNFYITLLVAVLQSGYSNSYVFQKTTTTFRQRPLSRFGSGGVTTSTTLASVVEDTNFSTFADSLELSSDDAAAGSKTTSSSSTATIITKDKNVFIDINKNDDGDEKSWQTKLDELLLPTTNLAERQILLSELLTSNDKIRDSVLDALTNRKLDPLLTPTQKKLQEGTRAVVRQLANDILPQITSSAAEVSSRRVPPGPPDIESIGNRFFSAVTKQMQKNFEELQEDLTDPINKIPARLEKQREMLEKQRDEVLQEARNVFLEKPEGLEEPSYTIVKSLDLYEIRQYDAYTVASTRTSASDGDDINVNVNVFDDGMAAGSAFNTLASYIFGANDENKNLGMTTPVTQTSSGDMRFYISTKTIDDGRIPQPQEPDNIDTTTASSTTAATTTDDKNKVEIVQIPSALLAVRKFRGFVTDGEVARQKDTLLQALEMDGIELDVAHGAIVPHVVFQYNPPYTLPMVRCNEIGVAVRNDNSDNDDAPPTSESLKKEWTVDDDDEVDDSK